MSVNDTTRGGREPTTLVEPDAPSVESAMATRIHAQVIAENGRCHYCDGDLDVFTPDSADVNVRCVDCGESYV
jgi:hypothetical protein